MVIKWNEEYRMSDAFSFIMVWIIWFSVCRRTDEKKPALTRVQRPTPAMFL